MVKSVTLLFPGQGSQYVGMAKSFVDSDAKTFETANKIVNTDLLSLMQEGPVEQLTLTQNTQPAILLHSILLFQKLQKVLLKNNITIDRVLGHSVGEYAALVAAGALSLEDGLSAVRKRGLFMQEAVPAGKGSMYALMKVPAEVIIKACQEASTDTDKVMPANFNSPDQIVISGETEATKRAIHWIETNFEGVFRAVELNVSAPFHSSLMKPAATSLLGELNQLSFKPNTIPYIANIDALEYAAGTKPETIIQNLYKQVEGSVLWTQSIQNLPHDTLCIEVGPGRVLMGLVRKINRQIKVIPLDKEGAFESLTELFL